MGLFDGFRHNKTRPAPEVPGEPAASQSSAPEQVAEQAASTVAPEAVPQNMPSGVEATEQAPVTVPAVPPQSTVESVSTTPVTPAPQPVGQAEPQPSMVKNVPVKPYEEKEPLARTIEDTKIYAIINQKGGVGKSTTAINLAAALGELGCAVLVVDLDPQGNTTSGLGVDKGRVVHDTYDLLLNELPSEEAIVPDVCQGLDLIPATINLAGAEVELVNELARENRLKTALSTLRGKYDFILIDCPPALGLLTVNALVAADKLIIPIQTEFYALEGVTKLLDSMKRVKNALNPTLDIFGVLLTMYDGRTMLARQVATEVRNFFGPKVFNTIIPRTVRLSEAPSFGQPITEYDPQGRGALSYKALAKEVIERA